MRTETKTKLRWAVQVLCRSGEWRDLDRYDDERDARAALGLWTGQQPVRVARIKIMTETTPLT